MTKTEELAADSPIENRVIRGLVYTVALSFVLIGLLNVTPAIPGWDQLGKDITGWSNFKVRRFPTEWFYPLVFFAMMLIVALKHSIWRSWAQYGATRRALGLLLDVALVLAALTVSLTYLTEIEAICLFDQITGDRARLVAQVLQSEIEFAELLGLPIPDSADDPACLNTTGVWLPLILLLCVVVFLVYNIKVWGLPLVLVAIIIAAYTFATVLNWYIWGAEGQSKYLITILGSDEARSLADGRLHVRDAVVNQGSGILGRFINVLMLLVFPYIILGALFGRCAGGQSLIKLAFLLTRNLRGGPAHAAVVSSAMFGTITGGPVVNVLSTGVLTIPMMLKRGFSRVFAGGVEAAASSGGSIMPPIMGVAAFVMAVLTGVPYREIVIAAIIPALLYFFCLFLSVIFQARKQRIEAVGEVGPEMKLEWRDFLSLLQIFLPILLVLLLILTPKDSIGCDPISQMLGAVVVETDRGCRVTSLPWIMALFQNSAGDASAAGWWATVLLFFLMFLDREIRLNPKKVFDALAEAGVTIATLYLMFLAVTVIDVSLNLTALAKFVAVDVLSFLKSFDASSGDIGFQLFALLLTMLLAVLLGMGMPAVPAYINVALLMGPLLIGLGLATFTSHMFIFYFAIASSITPPVALAAFAASTITKADPMATGFSAVKSGIVLFVIPFVFAIYPEILLIDKAVLDPNSGAMLAYLPGYDGSTDWGALGILLGRILLALYLLSSALSAFDVKRLSRLEVALRVSLAALVLFRPVEIYAPASALSLALLGFHFLQFWRSEQNGSAEHKHGS